VIWGLAVFEEEVVELLFDARRYFAGRRRQTANEIHEHRAQVRAVAQQDRCTVALAKQEREDRHVGLRAIAILAGEDEVVSPIIGTLASTGRDVVERDGGGRNAASAVRADGAVLLDEPTLRLGVGRAAGRCRRQLWVPPSTTTRATAFLDGWSLQN